MLSLFKSPNKNIERAIVLEQAGQKEKALQLMIETVAKYPNCKACRGHMGRLAEEVLHEKKTIEKQINTNLN